MIKKLPVVRKRKDTITITIDVRSAELMAMFLGTFSQVAFAKTINDYYGRYPRSNQYSPDLCEPHIPVSNPDWVWCECAVAGRIFNGLTNVLKWSEKENARDKESDTNEI